MLAERFIRRHPRRVLALAIIVAVVAITGFCLLFRSPPHGPADRGPASASAGESVERPEPDAPVRSEGTDLAASADPAVFAASVARALFDWDTTAPSSRAEHAGRLLAVADPSGQEAAGLAADVAAYLPTQEGWAFLKSYYTRQWIEIDSVRVPELWAQAVAEAGPDGLAPGTAALTVRGVRHREGVWDGSPVASQHDVVFTVFVLCGPSYATCHLLRLSRLDDPLD